MSIARIILLAIGGVLYLAVIGVLVNLFQNRLLEWLLRRLQPRFKRSPPTPPPGSAKFWDGRDPRHHRIAHGLSVAAGILAVAGMITILLVFLGLNPLFLWAGFGAIGLAAITLGVIFGTSDRDFYT